MIEYDVLYADPPWRYEHPVSKSRSIESHYPTMELEEIKKLQVPAAENSILFLWATAPKLDEALQVLKAWGFNYRSCAVWDKEALGMGYYFRIRHELLLCGVKGTFKPPPEHMRIPSIYREWRGEHSAKPGYFRQQISEWYPDARKIELFARDRIEGWDAWGNEVPKTTQQLISNVNNRS